MTSTLQEPIQPDCLYPIDLLKRLMGWSHHAWRSAKQSGLKVRTAGKRRYVFGKDVITWLESLDDRAE